MYGDLSELKGERQRLLFAEQRKTIRCTWLDRLLRVLLSVALVTHCFPLAEVDAQEVQANDDAMRLLDAAQQATISAIAAAESSVVAISRVRRDAAANSRADVLRLDSPFAFQETPENPDFVPTFFGSGVVISDDGFIVTCAHVLDDPRRNDYFVWLNKRSYVARVIGRPAKVYAADPFSDLAVLKIDASGLQPITLVETDDLRKGQFVIALGNPYAIAKDGQASASWGIIANLKRVAPAQPEAESPLVKETIHQFGTLIQTDATLNLGFSGGALINLKGEMIGLTTALAATSGYEQSAGYAIAVDSMFHRVVKSLKEGKLPEFGFLGIQPEDLRLIDRARGFSGARVSVVIPGLPGDQAGLRSEDIILQVGDNVVLDRNDLFRELSALEAGSKVDLVVQRLNPGSRTEILRLPAKLSKKYVATSRPGYALHAPATWRGMQVEFSTAVPSELLRTGTMGMGRNAPKLAVFSVEPDTPAWNAGLRAGCGIISVEGKLLQTPEEFMTLVQAQDGDVAMVISRPGESHTTIMVPIAGD